MWQSDERASLAAGCRARSNPKSNQRAIGIDDERARALDRRKKSTMGAQRADASRFTVIGFFDNPSEEAPRLDHLFLRLLSLLREADQISMVCRQISPDSPGPLMRRASYGGLRL